MNTIGTVFVITPLSLNLKLNVIVNPCCYCGVKQLILCMCFSSYAKSCRSGSTSQENQEDSYSPQRYSEINRAIIYMKVFLLIRMLKLSVKENILGKLILRQKLHIKLT